jgi:CHAT domain-containing protein
LVSAQDEAQLGYRQFSGRSLEWAWKFRLLDAEIMAWRGLSADALSLLDANPAPPTNNPEFAVRRSMLRGLVCARLARFPEADQNLQEAERSCQAARCTFLDEIANTRGILEFKRGNLLLAEHSYRDARQFAAQQGDSFLELMALLNLGTVAMNDERYDESIDWSTSANDLAHSLNAQQMSEKVQGNLGWAYYKLGDFDKSLMLYLQAVKSAEELGLIYDQVKWLQAIGDVYADTGRFMEAEASYEKALELARRIQSKEEIIDTLISLAFVSVRTNQFDRGKQYSEQSARLGRDRGDRLDELYPLLAGGEADARSGNVREAERAFLEVAHDPQSDPSLRWEAEDELAKLYEQQHRMEEADRLYRIALSTFESVRSSLQRDESKLPFLANATHLYDDYIRFLVQQGKAAEALMLADYSRAQTLSEGLHLLQKNPSRSISTLGPRQVAKSANAAILFYWLGSTHSYLWAITPQQVKLFPLPTTSEIDAAVQSYRKALLASRDPLQTSNPDGIRLFDMLVRPAMQIIAPDSRVVVMPDGSLNNLNFETLLVAEPKPHYWIEDVTIANASSLRLLAASHSSPKNKTGNLLLIGDAVAPSPEYQELPKAKTEIENIEKHFTPSAVRVYTRAQAIAPAYLTGSPEQFAYIHFVAHGTASRLSPLDSAVVLSKASADQDSFKLYAREIIKHPLHADLVTISTCYGAGDRAYTGEGLVGLSWAFLRAGAHNVIGALWEVSDASTPLLMDELYGELEQGMSPESALRAAKLSLLHSDGVFRKPFYWAPFQLYTGS